MHTHSFHHVHVLDRGLAAIEQHVLVKVMLVMLLILVVGYVLSIQTDRVGMSQFSDVSEGKIRLSRFADPQYAHEVAAREQMMRTTLDTLRRNLQADRAYIAVYGSMSDGIWIENQVINIVEVTKPGIALTLQGLQGLGRSSWLQMEDNTRGASWLFAENLARVYGMELYDEQGTPIGYLGIEKTQEHGFAKQDIQRLRKTAEAVITALVKPLEQVKDSR